MRNGRSSARKSPAIQVAAVCYRRAGASVEILLVRTSSGRWTFPKGHVEDHLPLPDVAALEAFEEAGATGEVDPRPVGSYVHRKESLRGCITKDVSVVAFLMRVTKTSIAMESHRMPRWCSVREARERLEQGRRGRYRTDVVDVLGAALRRIEAARARIA